MTRVAEKRPTLENLIEGEDIGLEVLHPGGLDITQELAQLCHVHQGALVLDVASGTGESACYLARRFNCRLLGLDVSDHMVRRARRKAKEQGLSAAFIIGDAHHLPFAPNVFGAVISECTTCLLEKEAALREMARVAESQGFVGIHDLCWKEDTPERLKRRLAEIEDERPETLEGWRSLFERVGLEDVVAVDKSHLIPEWMKVSRAKIGLMGELRVFLKVIRSWGVRGALTVWESVRIFQSRHIGYGVIVGRKR